jgi:hypothetical protein
MKMFIYLAGVLACLAVIAGALLSILHIEGARLLLTFGLSLFFVYLASKSFSGKKI